MTIPFSSLPPAMKAQALAKLGVDAPPKRARRKPGEPKQESELEIEMAFQLRAAGIVFEREHHFHSERAWRFDFIFPPHKLALEVDGGTWSQGRHTRGGGVAGDIEKMNEAAMASWIVLRCDGDMVKDGRALALVEKAVATFG